MRSRGRRAFGLALLSAAALVALILVRHARGSMGRSVRGGILVADIGLYDAVGHRFLLRSFFEGVARDVAASAPEGARVLEVGCGPGRLSIRLSGEFGLDLTGLDLDSAMIDRARANTRAADGHDRRAPLFLVGDVASLSFRDGSFDLVVSTLSMHHWADPSEGLAEMPASCVLAAERWSGTSGRGSCPSTHGPPIRPSTRTARSSGSSARRPGAGLGG
jgi:SAM-dependent methyltransferase